MMLLLAIWGMLVLLGWKIDDIKKEMIRHNKVIEQSR
jgi:hypothetical protein